jgi:hypothetical protein
MGQFALGIRSLLIRLAVFFVMAALLAWALGGTLWPRAETVELDAVSFDGAQWFWRLSVGGRDRGLVRWTLMRRRGAGEAAAVDDQVWFEVAGPVATPEAIYFAGRASRNPEEPWRIEGVGAGAVGWREPGDAAAARPALLASPPGTPLALPDRLAVERQLARLRAGLPLQDAAEVRRQRPHVLEPPSGEGE